MLDGKENILCFLVSSFLSAWLLSFLLHHGLGSPFSHSEEEIDISPLDRSILSLEDKGKMPSLPGPFDDLFPICLRAPEIWMSMKDIEWDVFKTVDI